ncbi:MAG: KpsF/GutQ family sugar-phosphate isomerase [Verrucomicrobiota bacterium]
MDSIQKAKQVIQLEIQALRDLRKNLDLRFSAAIELLLKTTQAGRKIVVMGVGKSGHIGEKIAATLSSTGTPAVVLDSVNAAHGDLGVVSEGDLCLILSYSGQTEEILRVLSAIKRQSAGIIAMTGNPKSTLAMNADIHLNVKVRREACPLNLAPTSSTTAMMALGDALAMVLLEARGFRKEDFARYHPAGNLGKHLLLRVEEVMRPLDQVPLLSEKDSVNDALRWWNLKRAGAVIVVNSKKKLAGIYTHGDFVRGYQADPKVGTLKLKDVMTPKPITVRIDNLAVEVLNIFQKHRIDDLVVVDSLNRPVGMIDAQDLAKQKLM